jgi:predicted nucleic acid-binding protein
VPFLIDTNVISEQGRPDAHEGTANWYRAQASQNLYLSVITIAELRQGVAKLVRRGAIDAARDIENWVNGVERHYGGRILPVDTAVAQAWANLPLTRTLPALDSLIAATAMAHGLTVVTRNVKDFAGTGVGVYNPFEG